MTKEDYKILKKLVRKFPKHFTAESSKVDDETLIRFYHANWLARWGTNEAPAWRIEHKANEALEEYEKIIKGENRAKRAELMAFVALLISALALWRAW